MPISRPPLLHQIRHQPKDPHGCKHHGDSREQRRAAQVQTRPEDGIPNDLIYRRDVVHARLRLDLTDDAAKVGENRRDVTVSPNREIRPELREGKSGNLLRG